jgi:hypothetical protein
MAKKTQRKAKVAKPKAMERPTKTKHIRPKTM